ncbi:lipopolysaccharide biosynthesis protein [Candidatus Pristimantibacillus sp. PTI5]|uniref:lipopolysaccharide biosynthesis protein n=1 Tax=Candidatus Pristimantibacillus sp. PTI5 TaxID=3400422 RepID=UPI003B0298F6
MRVKNSLLNITAGLGNQLIITILSFASRTIFINSLGLEYLGVNALFTSILAMLSLAEAGIGASIVYNLYKPIADNDQPKIMALMNLYRKAYLIIAAVVMTLGLALLPFLGLFIKDTNVENITLIYLVFLFNTAVPYLFVYKHSYLNVNQKNYIVTAVFSVSTIISTLIKIAILYYTENYILYLVVESAIAITTSIILAGIVDRMFPFLKQKIVEKLDQETKQKFIKNMKAILLQNMGNYLIFGVESILISALVSVVAVGIYSNYKMLIDICRTFVNQVFSNMYHSVGNLIAKENAEQIYHIYKVTMLLNFWLYSLIAISLNLLISPLIELWVGSEFLMGQFTLVVVIIAFYERGMRNSISMVKVTAGIFHEDRFAPLIQGTLSLGISLILVHYIGITGVFIGTIISALLVLFWTTPYLVYKKVFHQPLRLYYQRYGLYTGIGIATYLITYLANSVIPSSNFGWLFLKAVVCLLIVNLTYILIFHKTEEYKYLLGIVIGITNKFPRLQLITQKLFNRNRNLEIGGNK